uniref:elongation of very long chain fatty acids protein 4-like n=1 Tax=Styela clava TaxID=7725 RepID=UPI00193A70B7|nr:elongation of very long chain fatty acids protein 4-like [Styela clava]
MWDDIVAAYRTAVDERADPRTSEWPLVYSPWWPIGIGIVYNLFCWNARKITSNLPAYGMRKIIVFYNFVMVLLSLYMTYEFFVTAYLSSYNLACQPVDYSNHPLAIRMAKVCWWYYFSKYIELMETVFFALRKKYNQISVLHVYHHTSMLCIWWMGIKYVAGGQSFLFGLINSFVHAIMYTYYGLSAIGPHMQKYLWWKKYITVIQLSQFFILAWHSTNNLKVNCEFPTWLNKVLFVYAITLGVFFLNFYFQTYWLKKKSSGAQTAGKNGKEVISNGKMKNGDTTSQNGHYKIHDLQARKRN